MNRIAVPLCIPHPIERRLALLVLLKAAGYCVNTPAFSLKVSCDRSKKGAKGYSHGRCEEDTRLWEITNVCGYRMHEALPLKRPSTAWSFDHSLS